jgi:hypothetical protein
VGVDENTARSRLGQGLFALNEASSDWDRHEDYYRGVQDLPFAPEGVNQEYLELREMASANWLALAMDAPVQRLRAEGFRTGRDEDADQTAWDEVWQPNKLDARQRIPYTQMMVHGRGLMSVWKNADDRKSPRIRSSPGRGSTSSRTRRTRSRRPGREVVLDPGPADRRGDPVRHPLFRPPTSPSSTTTPLGAVREARHGLGHDASLTPGNWEIVKDKAATTDSAACRSWRSTSTWTPTAVPTRR